MPSTTLNQLVRDQILAEGPEEFDGMYMTSVPTQERYINEQLNAMTNAQLLERISDALTAIQSEQSVRLGL
jgi:hypothetical protein